MSSGGTGQTNKPAPETAIEIGVVDASGKLQAVSATNPLPVDGSITATNPSVAATGAAVPADATYVGMTVGGNLTGLPGTADGLKVDGSAVTQPVSAASLPLPAGAATAAKQPALGTAGTASSDVISVQGIASMTALKVDGSAVTQPVSAASLPLPSGAATSALQTTGNTSLTTIATNTPAVGQALMAASSPVVIASNQSAVPVSGTFWQATQPVSAASLPLPTGAATAAKQPALGTAGTPSADVITVQGKASMTALLVDGSAVTQPVSLATVNPAAGRALVSNVYNAYGTTPVTTSAYVQLIASTSAAINLLYIGDTSGSGLYIATGGSGSEVNKLIVPPGGRDAPYELSIPSGTRVSVKAVDQNASTGGLYFTAFS